MLILMAHNVTGGNGTRRDGTADYEVQLAINDRVFWKGSVDGHVRADGAAALLRRIADRMDPSRHDIERDKKWARKQPHGTA